MICRKNEEVSTVLACALGIDAQLLVWDHEELEGAKVTEFIRDAVTLNEEDMRLPATIRNVAGILKKLHSCNVDTGISFNVFEMADTYESVIRMHGVKMYPDYEKTKERIMEIKRRIDKEDVVQVVPCHNDPLPANWVYGQDRLYLIDWEYAGMNDRMWDLADVSVEVGYTEKQDDMLLMEYLGYMPSRIDKMRFMANKLYVDFLWTLWGKARTPFDGEEMEAYALGRYKRLKSNLKNYDQVG